MILFLVICELICILLHLGDILWQTRSGSCNSVEDAIHEVPEWNGLRDRIVAHEKLILLRKTP